MKELLKINNNSHNSRKILTIFLLLSLATPTIIFANITNQNDSRIAVTNNTSSHDQPSLEDIQLRSFEPTNQPVQMIDVNQSSRILGYQQPNTVLEKPLQQTEQTLTNDLDVTNNITLRTYQEIKEPLTERPLTVDPIAELIEIQQQRNKKNTLQAENTHSKDIKLKIEEDIGIENNKPFIKVPVQELPQQNPEEIAEALLKNARKHSNKKTKTSSIPNIPAFKALMNKGVKQLKNNDLEMAADSFTRAQRIIPQSSAVYFYLGQIALKKQEPINAEAFARRGLVVSDSNQRKKMLWNLILKSAKLQENKKTITEAKKALQ